MSNIEPTEEQKQAARAWWDSTDLVNADDIARLLAEREAKLRERQETMKGLIAALDEGRATLRARVAELEAKQARLKHLANDEVAACGVHIDSLEKLLAASAEREAQHLADIKALRVDLSDACDELCAVVRYDAGENYGGPYNVDNAELVRAQLARRILATAHYDDAKAAEGGEG